MKRKTSLSLLKFPDNGNCIVSPNIVGNIVYISNMILPNMSSESVVAGDQDSDRIHIVNDEIIDSQYVRGFMSDSVVIGIS
ncbi:MAG: hypothetical protein J6T98_06170 [Salinivirgaceae bacterium]|nr:hypothetical protein [Salinivirgaceae bacterium]